jgi:hypothetical protein
MKYLWFAILSFFALFGAVIGGTVFHELYHQHSFKNLNPTNESICLVTYPELVGEYKFRTNQTIEVEERRFNSEFVAYSISALFAVIFLIAFTKQLILNMDWGDIK